MLILLQSWHATPELKKAVRNCFENQQIYHNIHLGFIYQKFRKYKTQQFYQKAMSSDFFLFLSTKGHIVLRILNIKWFFLPQRKE